MGFVQTLARRRATLLAGLAITVLLIVSLLPWTRAATDDGRPLVVVHAGDGTTQTLPLDVDDRLVIEDALGSNVIAIRDGTAFMEDADCPNGDCMRQRAISTPGEQIICLPHRLWVTIATSGSEDDGAMDVSAVVWAERQGDGADPRDDVDFVSR